jgi:hypothetical protein
MKTILLILLAAISRATPITELPPAPLGYEWGTAFNNPLTGEDLGFILVPIEVCCSDFVPITFNPPPVSVIEPPTTIAPEPSYEFSLAFLIFVLILIVLFRKEKS